MSKEAMKLALEALEAGEYYIDDLEAIVYAADDLGTHEDRAKMQAAIVALREALANEALDKKAENARELGLDYEPAPATELREQEPVAHAVIAGALFDFMGWLTSRKERLVLSSADNASPAVEAITEFAKMRGLSLNDAKVQDWNTSPPAQQEPVAWTPINQPYPPGGELDILMGDGSILCDVLPQADGDLWWGGASTGERFIDPKYASVTHWRIHAEHTSPPAQRTWVGLGDEELGKVEVSAADFENGFVDLRLICRAIEAKLRSKNEDRN